MSILVTGGAGYIGSHAVQRLLRDGRTVIALDNLSRGNERAIELLAGGAGKRLVFERGDIGDRAAVEALMRRHGVRTVLHFAALAYVGESVDEPLRYYRNNAASALSLIEACDAAGVDRFVFSSTCATYGEPPEGFIPIPENCPQRPMSPYGRSKLHVEHMLADWAEARRRAGRPVAYAALRYFNVAGCDRSGVLGEDHDPETHLIPVVLRTVLGKASEVTVFGEDYPTPDGTCVRDYVHVEDLVDAHVKVLDALKPGEARAYNLGTGRGHSVREILESAKRVTGKPFAVKMGARRAGDPARLFADPGLIQRELGWAAAITDLDEMVRTAWEWMRKNPDGYKQE